MEPTISEQVSVEQNNIPTINSPLQITGVTPGSRSKTILIVMGVFITIGSAGALYYFKDTLSALVKPKSSPTVVPVVLVAQNEASTTGVISSTTSNYVEPLQKDDTGLSGFTESDLIGRWTDKEGKGGSDWELVIDTTGKHIYKSYGKKGELECTDTWAINGGMLTYQCASSEEKKDKTYLPFTVSLGVTYNKVTGELTIVDEDTTSVWKKVSNLKNNTIINNKNMQQETDSDLKTSLETAYNNVRTGGQL